MVMALAPSGTLQMGSKDKAAWHTIEPAVAFIVRGHVDIGSAALVDSRGIFVTYLGCVYAPHVTARLADGRIVGMTLKASDDVTQLAVLQADDWIRGARPLAPEEDPINVGDRLLAILPSGGNPVRAEYEGTKHGLLASSKRLMSLSEINFAAPANMIGGSLIVSMDGEIVGFLNAALHSRQETSNNDETQSFEAGSAGGGAGAIAKPSISKTLKAMLEIRPKRYGPPEMTTAYTVAPNVFRRTMEDLISGRGVDRPSIGVDVKNAPGGGALIETVEPGSTAAQSGLKPGDVVFEINGKPIDDQVALAKAVMDHQVGASLVVKVRRGRSMLIVPVRVESHQAKRPPNPQGAT